MSDDPRAVENRFLQALRHRWQYFVVIAVLCAGVAVSSAMFVVLRTQERGRMREEFEQRSQDHLAALQKTLDLDLLVMKSVELFYIGSKEVDRGEFEVFASPLMADHPSFRALQWAPRIPESKRTQFSMAAASDGHPGFQITEYDRKGKLIPASHREEYYPIFFVAPSHANVAALGFDLATNPACLEAMNRSRDANQPVMTSRIRLPDESGDQIGVRLFVPIYENKTAINTVENRRKNLAGFAVAVLRLGGIAEESLEGFAPVGIDVHLLDSTDTRHEQPLYLHGMHLRAPNVALAEEDDPRGHSDLCSTRTFDMAGRCWTAICEASPQFIAMEATWYPWGAGAAGLLLTGLVAAYLVGIAVHNARTARDAAQLAEANQRLWKEIADREQAEATLWASEMRYKTLFDSSNDAIMLLSVDEGYLSANPAVAALFGCKDESEFISCTPVQFSPAHQPDGALSSAKAQQMMAIAVQEGSHRFEWTHKRLDETEFLAAVSLTRLESEGKCLLLATVRDITEQRQMEQRQARSLKRLEGVNRLQEELILPVPIEEKFKKITEAAVELLDLDFCRIWMVKPGDLCEKGCIHVTAEEQCHICPRHDICLHLMASSGRYTHIDGNHRRVPLGCYKIGRIASGEDNKFLTNNATTDPRVHNHEWASSLGLASFAGYKLRDADGAPIGVMAMFAKHPISEEDDAFLSNLAETTSRVILEDNASTALHASERRHRLFAQNVSDVIWTMDASGRFTYMSPSVQQMLGYKWEDGIQLTVGDIMTPSSLAVTREKLATIAAAVQSGQRVEPMSLELELVRKDGSTLWSGITISAMYDETGQMIAVQGITRDITAHKQMEDELRKAKAAAEAATCAKSRFLANMSHEIRTPMTAILGYADLLMDPTLNASSRNNYSATIRRSGEHLLTLINDILDLSKIEAGKMSLNMTRCNVVSLLADVASVVRPRAESHGISFTIEYVGELPETIRTDAARLRQAIINLAGNAVKFTAHGSVRIAVSFLRQWQAGQPAVKFEVIDTGIGIRSEVIPQLFQPFGQGDVSVTQKFGGTGLGLVISRHIAHMLGGELTAASVYGQGSTFTLIVSTGSLKDIHMLQRPVEAEQETAGHVWQAAVEDLKGVRILLAEDGFDNRELIKTVLHMAGAEVETAENGRLAVDRAEGESFDLILMDMNMPEMDGYEATSLLRNHGYDKPILALTANAMFGDSDRCLAVGCNEYLPKPINRAQLIRTIAAYVGRRIDANEETPAPAATPTTSDDKAIISRYVDDPEIATVLEGFVGRLGGQLGAMRNAYATVQYEDLRSLAHKLKGAGGCYGFPILTDACKVLEDSAKAQDGIASKVALDTVAALIQAIENGYAATAAAGST